MAKISRRQFIKSGIVAGGAAMVAPGLLHTAYAKKASMSIAAWNHWIPESNEVLKKLVEEWGKKNNVKVRLDLLGPSAVETLTITAAESRSGKGHDIMIFSGLDATLFKDKLEPLNDVADYIQGKYGKYDENSIYSCCQDGVWIALPAPMGSHSYPMVTRIDLWREHAGIDVVDIFPTDAMKRTPTKVDGYNTDAFLEGCKKVAKAGFMYGTPISECPDGTNILGPIFLSFGSVPVDEKGNITIESDETVQALEYMKELAQYMPKDVYGWDNGSNNRWLVSGKGSAIQNPPSAWASARRTRPDIAARVWHHDTPRGPKGRFRGCFYNQYGIWKFAENKKAAKEFLMYLSESAQQWKLLEAAQGYDMAQLKPLFAHPIWNKVGPPKGTQYNYIPRGDERLIVAGWPANPDIAAQIRSKYLFSVMTAKVTAEGMKPKEAMKWCAKELEEIMK